MDLGSPADRAGRDPSGAGRLRTPPADAGTGDGDTLRLTLHAAFRRFCALLASAGDGAQPVPGLQWTVGELGAHLVTGARLWARMLDGEPSPIARLADASAHTARMLAEFPERDPAALADLLLHEAWAIADGLARRPAEEPFPWHAGLTLTMAQATSVGLGELLVHGFDLARALRTRWPIDPADAVLVIRGLAAVLPAAVDPEQAGRLDAAFELRLGPTERLGLHVHDGHLRVTPGPVERAGCRIRAEPVAFLLVGYGRTTAWAAAVHGRMVAWGRRPWLAVRLGRLIQPL